MKSKSLTIITVISLFLPMRSGQAQNYSVMQQDYEDLKEEVDSLQRQVNLNVDLLKYQADKSLPNQ